MDNYSLIPNKLFYEKDSQGLIKKYNNDKILLVADYLYIHTNRYNVSYFTLEDMMLYNFLKINRHLNKVASQFIEILEVFINLNILKLHNKQLNKIKTSEYVECDFSILNKNDNGDNINFIQLYQWEKEKILKYKGKNNKEQIDTVKMLVYYCYLKSRIHKRSNEDGRRIVNGGTAEVCYPSFLQICKDINMTERTIAKYNEILVKLNMIRYKNAGVWYYRGDDKKVLRESNNTYILYQKNWEEDLDDFIKFYKETKKDERIFADNGYKNNNRAINGYIGRINYLEKKGVATEEQIKKRDEYLKLKKQADNKE